MKEYYDILNRRKPMEDVGDAFKGQADAIRPMNVGQRREQALMRGFGAGINMGARAVDESKIREIEEDSKQMAMLQKELTMSTGKNQLREQKIKSFIADQDSNLKLASDLIVKGKYDQLDIFAPSIFNAFKEHTGTNLGEYKFSKNGHVTYKTPDGKLETVEFKTLFNPIMNYIPPEDRGNYKGFLTSYQAEELDAIVEARRLKNELLESQINSANASAKLHKSQSEKVLKESQNPPMTDRQKIVFKNSVENNQKWINEESSKLLNKKILVETLDTLEKVLIEADKTGDVGSNIIPIANRFFGKYITGNNKDVTLADMVKAAYFGRIKEVGGSNPSTTEMLTTLDTIPNANKNLFASLQVLNKDRNNALKDIMRFNTVEKNLRENDYQGSPYDPNVNTYTNEEFNKFVSDNTNKEKIKLSLPKTSKQEAVIIEIPIVDYEKYYNKGFRYYKGK